MLYNYLKTTFRNFRRNKLSTLINISGFSIGLAIFTLTILWISYELSYDKFHKNVDRIYRVIVEFDKDGKPDPFSSTPAPLGPAMKDQFPDVVEYVRTNGPHKELIVYENKQFWESLHYADPSIFNIFDFSLVNGKPEEALNHPNNIVLSENMAHKYFPEGDVIGKTLTVGLDYKKTYTVAGIMKNIPLNSQFQVEFLIPFSAIRGNLTWNHWNYETFVLLNEKNNVAGLQNQLIEFQNQYELGEDKLILQPFARIHSFSKLRRDNPQNVHFSKLLIYAGIALLILFLASVNFINLSLAKSTTRNKEIGLRKVIGASKKQLKRQFLSESVLITCISFLVAIPFIYFLFPVFGQVINKDFPIDELINFKSFAIVFSIMFLLGYINGIYPAYILSSYRPARILSGATNHKAPIPVKKALVVFQFVIAIFFISATTLLKSQLHFIKNKNLGFDKEQVIIIPVFYEQVRAKSDLLSQEIKKHASVANISFTSYLPTDYGYYQNVEWEGMEEGRIDHMSWMTVDNSFLELMDMKLVAGRNFEKSRSTDANKYIINQEAIKKFGWKNPTGKWMDIIGSGEVIGVVKNFHFKSLRDEIRPMALTIYPESSKYMYIKSSTKELSKTLTDVEYTWTTLFPNRPFEYTFLDNSLVSVYEKELRETRISNFLGFISILIAAMGILGLSTLLAANRIKEIGIRKVNGATITEILALLNQDFIKWVAIAFLIACPISYYAMNKWLENFAYKTSVSWWIFALAGGLALLIALVTLSLQSWIAARKNPVEALRYE